MDCDEDDDCDCDEDGVALSDEDESGVGREVADPACEVTDPASDVTETTADVASPITEDALPGAPVGTAGEVATSSLPLAGDGEDPVGVAPCVADSPEPIAEPAASEPDAESCRATGGCGRMLRQSCGYARLSAVSKVGDRCIVRAGYSSTKLDKSHVG